MKIAILREIDPFEHRVAATPETVKKMTAAGFEVSIEEGAGEASFIADQDYQSAGASLVAEIQPLLDHADIVLKVQRPVQNEKLNRHEADLLKEGSLLICLLQPKTNPDLLSRLSARSITAFSLDSVPRIARAQSMDPLSSQSNIAGYKAVIMAADRLKKMMPMMMTAAGTLAPAKVFVLGAGVAGLQAIATAKRLGAVVEAFDTRPAVKEQVESLGAKFLAIELPQEQTEDAGGYAKELSEEAHRLEQELIQKHVKESDIVVTTALIPGRPAPRLITEDTVRQMRPGSVIVDLAAEAGGNCDLTESGKEMIKHGISILGLLNVPSLMSFHASQLYARNVMNFLFELYHGGKIQVNIENPVIKGALVTHEGIVIQEVS